MIGTQFSLILLPTNKCNVACEYCFEDKTDDFMSHEQLSVIIDKLFDHMDEKSIASLTIYWQGGEVMILPPAWFERAYDLIKAKAEARDKHVRHSLQSNMIAYSPLWNGIIAEMFDNSVGTSMDFPNLYRKSKRGTPAQYTSIWTRNVRAAREAGIHIGVIAIPNQETLRLGAERFYSYFVEELGIPDFQVNTSFSGGELNDVKRESILDMEDLGAFFADLARIWVERGYRNGVRVGPIDELFNYFTGEHACLPCIWRANCADEFVSIDARGNIAQCDCWVTSYPHYWFGNIFEPRSFTELLQTSKARQRFEARPEQLMLHATCRECDYLSICHGGCPVRTYAISGNFFAKDPYCAVYKALFSAMRELSVTASAKRSRHALPVLQAY